MKRGNFVSKEEIKKIAEEVLDYVIPKGLPVWQIKEIMREVCHLSEWGRME